jgi:hypothetical protein
MILRKMGPNTVKKIQRSREVIGADAAFWRLGIYPPIEVCMGRRGNEGAQRHVPPSPFRFISGTGRWQRLAVAALFFEAVTRITHDVLEDFRHGIGAPLHFRHLVGGRDRISRGQGPPVTEEFPGERHRRRQRQQRGINRVRIDRNHKNILVDGYVSMFAFDSRCRNAFGFSRRFRWIISDDDVRRR